jgi:hypothetical protein
MALKQLKSQPLAHISLAFVTGALLEMVPSHLPAGVQEFVLGLVLHAPLDQITATVVASCLIDLAIFLPGFLAFNWAVRRRAHALSGRQVIAALFVVASALIVEYIVIGVGLWNLPETDPFTQFVIEIQSVYNFAVIGVLFAAAWWAGALTGSRKLSS